MLVTMIDIDRTKESVLLIVIDKGNFERMQKADPITLHSRFVGGCLDLPRHAKFNVIVAYEENMQKIYDFVNSGHLHELLIYLERGYQFDSEKDGIRFRSMMKH